MKQGRTLQELAVEVARQAGTKEDYVIDTRELTMLTPPAEAEGGTPELNLPGVAEFPMTDHAQRQLADRIGVPYKLWARLRGDHPDLLDGLINPLFRREPQRRMIRTLDGNARAFLSDRYRRRDNDEVLAMAVEGLKGIPDARVESCEVTESRMYLKVVTPRISMKVPVVGHTVCAAVIIKNSEIGNGALVVQPMVYTLECTNGMIAGKAARHFHVGRAVEAEAETYAVLTDEAREADDKAFMLKLRDSITAAVNETTFHAIIAQLGETASTKPMPKPMEGVQKLAKQYSLAEAETESVLHHLIQGANLTQYGLLNAVTRAAQDVESYDRATELEEIGGDILTLSKTDWRNLVGAR